MPHEPSFRPDPALFPFRSRWFDARAGRVHYIDEGEGPPILFLHGNPTWSFLYREVVSRLRRHFRCIAPDFLGFGLSEHPEEFGYAARDHAEVVRQLVQRLDLCDLTLMGHDWGGPVAMRVALDEKPRVRALVMGNTWYWRPTSFGMRLYGNVVASGPMQKLIVQRNFFVQRLLPAGTERRLGRTVLAHYAAVLPTPESRRGVAELAKQAASSDFWLGELEHGVPRILRDVPLLLTWGVRDSVLRPRLIERFRRDFRNVTVRRLRARHYIQEDAPAEIADAIEEFLRPRRREARGAAA